jgi:hypothetical protein
LVFDEPGFGIYNRDDVFKDTKMELILVVVGIVLILAVLGLLVWLIISNFAGRKEIAGQAAGRSG